MSVISEVKDTVIDAKKKYDKEKYIQVLEEQIEKLEKEIERLNTKVSKYENNDFLLNSDHLELFEIFRKNDYRCYEDEIRLYSKKSIDLEIALSELLENDYFEYPEAYALGARICLSIPEDKKIKFLQALKKQN